MSSLLAPLHAPLAATGAVFILLTLYKLLAFIWRHFLRPSNSLKRYGADKTKVLLQRPAATALVSHAPLTHPPPPPPFTGR